MRITKYHQSTFLLDGVQSRVLIDPGSYTAQAGAVAQDFGQVDAIVITHEHSDHFDVELVRSIVHHCPSATVFTTSPVADKLSSLGVDCEVVAAGQSHHVSDDVDLHFTIADHVNKGIRIEAVGVVAVLNGIRVYHTGDTRFIDASQYDPEAIANLDVLLVPIGNRGVVMGVDDALVFTAALKPRAAIPMHYDSPKDSGRINPEDFATRAKSALHHLPVLADTKLVILAPRETFEYNG